MYLSLRMLNIEDKDHLFFISHSINLEGYQIEGHQIIKSVPSTPIRHLPQMALLGMILA
jgi:hypothetical protein